ncbi:MAG: pilus assembly protein TadG-related protein [Phycisphaerae bacterium]
MKRMRSHRFQRRGNVVIVTAATVTTVFAFGALTIDLGSLYVARAELQRAADAAALAGAWRMIDQDRLLGNNAMDGILAAATQEVHRFGEMNKVLNLQNVVVTGEDMNMGRWNFAGGANQSIDGSVPGMEYNGVTIRILRNDQRSGSIAATFAQLLGFDSFNVGAQSTAAFDDTIRGYRVNEQTGNADLLPFALKVATWEDFVGGTIYAGDNYTYNVDGTVTTGADGIQEINLYPGAGLGQLPPGNFGTVDIGGSNNSTNDIARQILHGINADDLSHFGGQLVFDENGVIDLNGDTGLSAGVKDELAAIVGEPRGIPLFRSVAGNGNNANFEVVGFAGVRIMDVKLTGSMKSKYLIVQPAIVVDDAALGGGIAGTSYNVLRPAQIVE